MLYKYDLKRNVEINDFDIVKLILENDNKKSCLIGEVVGTSKHGFILKIWHWSEKLYLAPYQKTVAVSQLDLSKYNAEIIKIKEI